MKAWAGEGNAGPNTTENSDRQIRDNRMRCREEGVQGAAPQDTLQVLGRILNFLPQIQQHSWGTPLRASCLSVRSWSNWPPPHPSVLTYGTRRMGSSIVASIGGHFPGGR